MIDLSTKKAREFFFSDGLIELMVFIPLVIYGFNRSYISTGQSGLGGRIYDFSESMLFFFSWAFVIGGVATLVGFVNKRMKGQAIPELPLDPKTKEAV